MVINSENRTTSSNYEFYQNDQMLRINNVNYTLDRGVYTCTARNEVNTISASARLAIDRSSE